MHITYLIGNGFDLACDLKTRYTNVYDKYCKTDSPNEHIRKFKELIQNDNYENWTDFEMALPGFGKDINDFEKFSECIHDFMQFLEDYLAEELKRLDIESNRNDLANQLYQYIYHFYEYCLQDSRMTLRKLIKESNESIVCQFITFNYTDTLEKCLSTMNKRISKHNSYVYMYQEPIHVHGTLYDGILLGLDDEELYKDIPCPNIRKLKNLIDKVYINERYSSITSELLGILKDSRIIVIFGWSMGRSDSFWVESLKKLLVKNSGLHLVYVPYYSEAVNKRLRNQSLDREDEQKDFIAEKFEIPHEYRNRIHIVTDTDYMNLRFLTKRDTQEELVTA